MEQLIKQLKRHEGVRTHAYRDINGLLHIGCGRNIDGDTARKGPGLTMREIDEMLQNDIEVSIKELSKTYPWFNDLEDGARKDAVVNLHFNMGGPTLAKFKKALAHMETGSYDEAAAEFLSSRWAKQVKRRAIEVTDMIKTGTYIG